MLYPGSKDDCASVKSIRETSATVPEMVGHVTTAGDDRYFIVQQFRNKRLIAAATDRQPNVQPIRAY